MKNEHHILELDSVLKCFGTFQLLTDVYLKIETGEIIGLFGRNGTGKTVLLNILFGTMKAERKFIRLDNKKKLNTPYLEPDLISYLPQEHFTPKSFRLKKVVNSFIPDMANSFFEDDAIAERSRNAQMGSLSSGERRYLEIKLLLMNNSKFVLLDEPFNFLSPFLVEKVDELIKKHSVQRGIIITDHNYNNVLNICNRMLLIDNGVLKELTASEGLVEQGYLRRM